MFLRGERAIPPGQVSRLVLPFPHWANPGQVVSLTGAILRMVDGNILDILKLRVNRCMRFHEPHFQPCASVLEDLEEAELNFFIKCPCSLSSPAILSCRWRVGQ